jgi:hypothetical protein
MEATQVMEQANKIIEDFSTQKYVLYTVIFLIEVALCFWVGLKLL